MYMIAWNWRSLSTTASGLFREKKSDHFDHLRGLYCGTICDEDVEVI
jgi:hypothetical protein